MLYVLVCFLCLLTFIGNCLLQELNKLAGQNLVLTLAAVLNDVKGR